MTRKILILALVVLASQCSGRADAQDGMYVSGNLGYSLMNDFGGRYVSGAYPERNRDFVQKHDGGIALSGALGCATRSFRLEGELAYRTNNIRNFRELTTQDGNGYLSCLSLMGNVYYQLLDADVAPFVMAGIGVANSHARYAFDNGSISVSDTPAMAYQLGAGVAVPLVGSVNVDVAYRYFATTHLSSRIEDRVGYSAFDANLSGHALQVGLRVGL